MTARRQWLNPVPSGPLRSLLDTAAAVHKVFSADEAALDVMLALDRGDLKPIRYLAARWGWSKNHVHRSLADLLAMAAKWRTFDAPVVGQAGTGVGQAGTGIAEEEPKLDDVGTGVGQVGTRVGQYRTDPEHRPQKNPPEKDSAREEAAPAKVKPAAKPKPAPKPKPEPLVAPPGVEAETWADWLAHRTERKAPLTATQARHQTKQLATFSHAGHDPNAVIVTSIQRGWVGLFAPDARGGRGPVGGPQQAPRHGDLVRRGDAGGMDRGDGGTGRVPRHADGTAIRLTASERAGQLGPQYAADLVAAARALRIGRAGDALPGVG